jgi:sugar/nucleoside kinase (ribokinase family)
MTVDAVIAGHVSLDVFPELFGPLDLEPGRLNAIGPATFSTGGAVSNTGLAMRRLGVDVRLVGKVGDDLFGQAVIEAYRAVDPALADGLTIAPSAVTSYTIVINPPLRDRSYLHCSGANETFAAGDVRDEHLADARLFHFGYPPLMPRMYADRGSELRELFDHARRAGLVTSLDLSLPDPSSVAGRADWRSVFETALPAVDVFAPSLDELLFMLDRPRHDDLASGSPLATVIDRAYLLEVSSTLIALGSAVVAIKLGEHGLYLRTTADRTRLHPVLERLGLDAQEWRDREVLSPCFRARDVVGTTGSGDATIAGLLMAVLRGAGAPESATIATAVGACSVEAVDPTSGIPTWEDIAERLKRGWSRNDLEIDLGSVPTDHDATGTVVLR